MNTNINTDNYEAYLLDYMEGRLSRDEAEQLKAFVAAQGLDWEGLTEELPHLEAPTITYDGKESLKRKAAIVPLYVKIASAAAAAGLLLTVTLWPEKTLPRTEPIVELKPILPERLITSCEVTPLPQKTIQFVSNYTIAKAKPAVHKRAEMPLLAELEPIKPQALPSPNEPEFASIAYPKPTDLAFVPFDENEFAEEEHELSLIGKGISRLTDGRHDSFGSLIASGLSTAKKEVGLAATDFALTAYYRADEHLEEARERWEEKREE